MPGKNARGFFDAQGIAVGKGKPIPGLAGCAGDVPLLETGTEFKRLEIVAGYSNVGYYMGLPYTYLIQPISDESGHYFYGQVLELDGCQSHGDTFEEAYQNLQEAMEGWLEVKLEHRDAIPEPTISGKENFSGKFVLRIPKSLHKKLSIEAKKEGVSLNQYS